MEVRDLLVKLDRFENLLSDYAYDELTSKDAVSLKQKFQAFKLELNNKIFNEPTQTDLDTSQNREQALVLSKKVFHNASQTVELLQKLKKTAFSQDQEEIIQNVEINSLILMELSMNNYYKRNKNKR